ncbi:GntR family transcriptional regulator [Streptosporangium carneum]|uniref:GntR family transcriptional regulator n=1 Tax=Streptosporangium carneum TaxID=47481 RepID=UPI0022F31321|nr:GntR family transcriptional regulator [Streptosporangium carneum]
MDEHQGGGRTKQVEETSAEESVTDRAYASILHNALTGSYRAGERLTEARLTSDLGISRVPVREALQRLERDGIIELQRHRGAVIRVITRRDITEFFRVRALLEGGGAAASAAAATAGDPRNGGLLEGLGGQIGLLSRWIEEGHDCSAEEYALHSQEFHRLVVSSGENRLLIRIWDSLHLPVQRLNYFQRYRGEDFRVSIDEHAKIAWAILAGDATSAERLAREHVNRIAAHVFMLPDEEFNRVFNPGLSREPATTE